ncbi:MAG: TadE/TadG family type IV pilus assembly protein [Anaerolineae bacterium]|nr:pilus assembly protein [Ardenticatenia bacterium]HQZ70669.1 pilus assembly protein [Anaerolineae bacterium]
MKHHPNLSFHPSGLWSALRALAARFTADRSGATAVQALLLTPIIIVAFWGGFSVWKVIKIRDSLHHGTYQAARFLSFYGPEDPNEDLWTDIAEKIVIQELLNNPFTPKEGGNISVVDLTVTVDLLKDTRECKDPLTVTSKYTVRMLPVGSPQEGGYLANFDAITLEDVRNGEVLCQ